MASFNPRRMIGRAMNLPTGVAERHLPLPVSRAVSKFRGQTLASSIAGKTVMVTGASSGIGEASALMLARRGGTVVLVARSEDKLTNVAAQVEEHGGTAYVMPADLSSADSITDLADRVASETGGGIDILVNNAGHSIRRSLKHSFDRPHDFERTIELNYLGPVRLTMAFLPWMREQGFGHVINVSSAAVQIRTPRFAAYTASKAALDAFSDCAAAELIGDGIRFTTVSMPLVRTPMIAPTAMYKNFPSLSPDEAAERIGQAIVEKPRRIGTPYGHLVGAIEAVDPVAMETIRNRAYKSFPESGGRPKPVEQAVEGEATPENPAS